MKKIRSMESNNRIHKNIKQTIWLSKGKYLFSNATFYYNFIGKGKSHNASEEETRLRNQDTTKVIKWWKYLKI